VTSSFASRITSTSTFTPGRLPPGRLAAARGPGRTGRRREDLLGQDAGGRLLAVWPPIR